MQFNRISKEQREGLIQLNKDNKTRSRKSALNALSELEHDQSLFPPKYKYILITILKLLEVPINLVYEEKDVEAILTFDSRYEILWCIIKEFCFLTKLAVEGKAVGPGDKILVSNLYIDHIKATTPCTSIKTTIIVALLNLFSDRKIEPTGSFDCKNYYIHKKLNILLNSIVLFDKDKL